ncbi:hypothetical protein NPS53_08515 [Pseudomonas putida]|uniref:hypothetical protein n=1 Tax=Pseudomonas putida TaxID=303 RepID=UPI0023632583|nr:hypothetical protein [Pseudomonas putida]MDD2139615.1 hypothetical protein [Pseudomonas putida]HDS1721538.1 hypothetical protein [Pseudomonas putida]
MQAAFDLFGEVVETPKVSKPKAPVATKPRAKVTLDRRKIWGEGGYLATLEDDETSIHTTESFTENATIERLEKALCMSPVIKNGEWVEDGQFYKYKVTEEVKGERVFGKKGEILHFATQTMMISSAKNVLEATYDDTGSWLPRWSYWLFCHRLRIAGENEDPYELLKAFTAVMTQQDFLDASRKGESLRRVTKRLHMQEKRAKARAAIAAGSNAADEEAFEDLELKSA